MDDRNDLMVLQDEEINCIRQEMKELDDEEYEPTYDDIDAHCCSANRDWYGFCQICGAAVYGTSAYRELYGGE